MNEETENDLFINYEEQPEELAAILYKYENTLEDLNYLQCEKLLHEVEAIGFTFEYGLSAEPYNLRKL